MSDLAYNSPCYYLNVYKGEGRIVVEPLLKNVHGMWVKDPALHDIITDMDDCKSIGEALVKWIEYIENTPRTTREPRDGMSYTSFTKYKTWRSFFYKNLLVSVKSDKTQYSIVAPIRICQRGRGCGWAGGVKQHILPLTATAEEIGQAVLEAFVESEEFHNSLKCTPKDLESIEFKGEE